MPTRCSKCRRTARLRLPSASIPKATDGSDVAMNLRADDSFAEDEAWHEVSAAYSDFSQAVRVSPCPVSGARRGCEHACHHQISVLADNGGKRRGGLRLRQLRRGVLPERNGRAKPLRGRGYRRSAGAACHEMRMNASI